MTNLRRPRSILLSILFVLCLSNLSWAAEVLLRDDWLVMEQEGVPIGYGNDQFFQTADGYYYKGFFQVNMDFLGTPFVYLEHIDVWTDSEFRVTHALRVSDADGSQVRHEASFSYGQELTEVNVTVLEATGKPFNSYWSWEGVRPIYSSSSLMDKILRDEGLVVGKEYVYDTWEWGEVGSTKFQVREESNVVYNGIELPVFIVTQETGEVIVKAHMNEAGICYINETVGSDILINKVEQDDIPELQAMAADALIVPANRIVEHPYRTTFSLVTVDWRDVPMADFVWEDNRQCIAKIHDDFSIQLAITRDLRDFFGRIQLPVDDPQFASYLTDTDYITPSSPVVQSLVAEILDGETDAWEATKLILDWIFHNITSKMVVRTLTTDEILTAREGKCAEYATLFAAMARAAGLPTRIALGERYQGNIWVGHLWNEVWLGEWISVDPSHNQISPDVLLVKFIDSDTIMGTQGVRRGLVNKLNITIDEVQSDKIEGAPVLQTGLVGQRYSNAEYSCEITMPPGWLGMEAEDQGFPMLVMYDPNYPDFSAVLLMLSVPPGIKAEQLMASRIVALPNVLPNFVLQDQETGIINGEATSIASWTFNDEPLFVQENQILVKEDVAYLFVFTGPHETWLGHKEVIQEIVDSFATYR